MKFLIVMAYLNMIAQVSIGEIVIPHIKGFKIEESVTEVSDQASITIAKNYQQLKGNPILNYIKPGYPVEIKCGYVETGGLQTEFTGFVKPGISAEWPVIIDCDELFLLRQGSVSISERQITLRDLLHRIAPAYIIECPDCQLGKMLISKASPFKILTEVKKRYGFYSQVHGNILHVGYATDYSPSFTKNHMYTIGENVKDSKGLKFQTDVDFNVRVESCIIVKGKKKILSAGSKDKDARVIKVDVGQLRPTDEILKSLSDIYHQRIYEGYSGNIVGFGIPRTHAGDSIRIVNPAMPEREGNYFIEKVEIEYDVAHINRTNTLSFKLSD